MSNITINELIEEIWLNYHNIISVTVGHEDNASYRRYQHFLEFLIYKMNECIQLCLLEDNHKEWRNKYCIVDVIGNINNGLKHSNLQYESANVIGETRPIIYVYYDYNNNGFKSEYLSTENIILYNCCLNHIVVGFQGFLEKIYCNETNIDKHKIISHTNVTIADQ